MLWHPSCRRGCGDRAGCPQVFLDRALSGAPGRLEASPQGPRLRAGCPATHSASATATWHLLRKDLGHAPKGLLVMQQANAGASLKASSGGHLLPSLASARDPGHQPLSFCNETASRSNQPEQSGRRPEWPCVQIGPGEVASGGRTCPRLSLAYSALLEGHGGGTGEGCFHRVHHGEVTRAAVCPECWPWNRRLCFCRRRFLSETYRGDSDDEERV